MQTRYLVLCALLLSALTYSCGGGTSGIQDPGTDPQQHVWFHELQNRPGMPAAPPVDFAITDDGKLTSASYYKFFADSVNESSGGRWNVTNFAGQKQWILSNVSNSAPKAWRIGGNYWNNEDDSLLSHGFVIPDQTDGLAVTFWARWKIQSGDYCQAWWWEAGNPSLIAEFTADQNPSYPGWDKYYFQLPSNFSGNPLDVNLEFYFASNSSGNDWGFGVDNVAVYQRQLEPPSNVAASDGFIFQIQVTWTSENAGNITPDGFDVYRSDTMGGPYSYVASTTWPTQEYWDTPPSPFTTYYYVVQATKAGWPNSPDSNEDDGWYDSI